MRQVLLALAMALMAILPAAGAWADEGRTCDILDHVFPQPGRGAGGDNAFRPLPVMAPIRSQPGAAGTLSLSISMDHVSPAQKGYPGYIYVGNYQVNDIPAFREVIGANTSLQVINPDDGKTYKIENSCLSGPTWGYSGTQWELVQGDTLDVMFQSKLDYTGPGSVGRPVNGGVPCRASNLHTHGLLVSPYHPHLAGTGPYGDYVLDVTQPHHSLDFGTDIDDCGTNLGQFEHHGHGLTDLPLHYVDQIPGQPGVNSLVTGEHPSGLFWYHPHAHGYSREQIQGGTTGAITIGALTDYACPDGDGEPGDCKITNANIRVMELKDTQLVSNGSQWGTIYLPESTLCIPVGGTRHGECQGTEGQTGPTKWVFTVNGVQYPTAHIAAGKMEIWRIVNASDDMTYNLSIRKAGDDSTQLPYQVLARDGVSIAQGDKGKMRSELLIMPATRVEIAIPAPPGGGKYILHNDVAQTGGHGHGDIWPSIDLAVFDWAKPDTKDNSAPPAPLHVTTAVPVAETPIPHVDNVVNGLRGVCTFEPGDKRLVYFTHRFVTVLGDDAKGQSGLLPSVHEVFGLIAGIQHKNGAIDFYSDKNDKPLHTVQEVWEKGIHDGDPAFPAFGHNDWGTICTVKGNVEPWTLINYTGENHNFHLHQSKFSIDPNGVFQYPLPSIPMADYLRHTDAEIAQFANPEVTNYADTMPVPRGQSPCEADPNADGCRGKVKIECSGAPTDPACTRPGITSLIVSFTRAEQVGNFVYHCHIMEHEDGGMMAHIRVMCPAGDASCASQDAQQAICRPAQD